tara:strand:+ start:431 stop:697 length:267 start_codon:yes stop_codon:yes gene_type:complete
MINNNLLTSFIVSLIITGIYYYLTKSDDYDNENENENSHSRYITVFILIFIPGYLFLSSFYNGKTLFSGGNSESTNIESGSNDYRPPF